MPAGNTMRIYLFDCKTKAPIAIGRLERFVADWERKNKAAMPRQNLTSL